MDVLARAAVLVQPVPAATSAGPAAVVAAPAKPPLAALAAAVGAAQVLDSVTIIPKSPTSGRGAALVQAALAIGGSADALIQQATVPDAGPRAEAGAAASEPGGAKDAASAPPPAAEAPAAGAQGASSKKTKAQKRAGRLCGTPGCSQKDFHVGACDPEVSLSLAAAGNTARGSRKRGAAAAAATEPQPDANKVTAGIVIPVGLRRGVKVTALNHPRSNGPLAQPRTKAGPAAPAAKRSAEAPKAKRSTKNTQQSAEVGRSFAPVCARARARTR